MRVVFDVWIRDNGKRIYTPEEEVLFESIFNYIYDRIHLFIDEIDNEELTEDPKRPHAIMVYLLQEPYAIQPNGYSELLCEKIVGSFNENDNQLLWESVEKSILSLLN